MRMWINIIRTHPLHNLYSGGNDEMIPTSSTVCIASSTSTTQGEQHANSNIQSDDLQPDLTDVLDLK